MLRVRDLEKSLGLSIKLISLIVCGMKSFQLSEEMCAIGFQKNLTFNICLAEGKIGEKITETYDVSKKSKPCLLTIISCHWEV